MADDIRVRTSIDTDTSGSRGDIKKLTGDVDKLAKELGKLVNQFSSVTHAMGKSVVDLKELSVESRKLTKAKHDQYVTNKRLANSETLLSALFAKNSALAHKKYLHSLTGMRMGLVRFNDETKKVLVMQGKHVHLLNEESQAMTRFMLKGNLVSQTLDNMATKYINLGKNLQWTGRQMMVGITLPLVGMAAQSLRTAQSVAQVDRQLRRVVENDSLEKLNEDARELSETWGVNIEQIKQLQVAFAQAGFGGEQLKDLVRQTQEFSTVGDVAAESAQKLIQALALTGKSGDDLTETLAKLDVMSDETSLSMQDIADALPKILPIFRQYGGTVEQAAALLAGFTDNSIDAVEGANALKSVLVKAEPAMASAAAGIGTRLKGLRETLANVQDMTGIDLKLVTNTGELRSSLDVLLQLGAAANELSKTVAGQETLRNFTRELFGATQGSRGSAILQEIGQALQTTTGNASGLATAMSIASAEGADLVRVLQIYEQQQAATLSDPSLQFQANIQKLRNAAIEFGKTEILPVANQLLTKLISIIEKFQAMSPEFKGWAVKIGLAAAALGPIIYALGQFTIMAGTIAKILFTKPLKGLFSMSVASKHLLADSDALKESFSHIWDDYLKGPMDADAQALVKQQIEAAIREQNELTTAVERTTAAMAHEASTAGATSAAINAADEHMRASVVAPVGAAAGARGRIGGMVSGTSVSADDFLDDIIEMPEEELKRRYPEIYAAAGRRAAEVQAAADRRLDRVRTSEVHRMMGESVGQITRPVSPGMVADAQRELDELGSIKDIERGIGSRRRAAFEGPSRRRALMMMIRDQNAHLLDVARDAGGQMESLHRIRRDIERIFPTVAKYLGDAVDVTDPHAVRDIVANVKARLPKTPTGGAISTERNILRALGEMLGREIGGEHGAGGTRFNVPNLPPRGPLTAEDLVGARGTGRGSRLNREAAHLARTFMDRSGVDRTLRVLPTELAQLFIGSYTEEIVDIWVAQDPQLTALRDSGDTDAYRQARSSLRSSAARRAKDAFKATMAKPEDIDKLLPGILRSRGVSATDLVGDELRAAMARSKFNVSDSKLVRIVADQAHRGTNNAGIIAALAKELGVKASQIDDKTRAAVFSLSKAYQRLIGIPEGMSGLITGTGPGSIRGSGGHGDPTFNEAMRNLGMARDPIIENISEQAEAAMKRELRALSTQINELERVKRRAMGQFKDRVEYQTKEALQARERQLRDLDDELLRLKDRYRQKTSDLRYWQSQVVTYPTVHGVEVGEADLQAHRRAIEADIDNSPRVQAESERLVRNSESRIVEIRREANETAIRRAAEDARINRRNADITLRRQQTNVRRRGRSVITAIATGGLLGDFRGGMSQREYDARQALALQDPFADPSRRDIRNQIRGEREPRSRGRLRGAIAAPGRFVQGVRDVRSNGRGLLGTGKDALLSAANWAAPGTGIRRSLPEMRKMGGMMANLRKGAGGLFQAFDMFATGGAMAGPGGLLGGISMAPLGIALAIILAIAAAVFVVWKNWDKVKEGVGGALDRLINAGKALMDTVLAPIRGLFERLSGDGEKAGEGIGGMWKNVGVVLGRVFALISMAIEKILPVVKFVMETIMSVIYMIVQAFRAVFALLSGDWEDFGQALGNIWKEIWNVLGNIAAAGVNAIIEIVSQMLQIIVEAIGSATGALVDVVAFLNPFGGAGPLEQIRGWENSLNGIIEDLENAAQGGVSDFFGQDSDFSDRGRRDGRNYGDAAGEGAEDALGEHDPLPGPDVGDDGEAENKGREYVENFISGFRNNMRQVVDSWKQAALDAFDLFSEAQVQAIDDQIQALDDLTKAEEEAQRQREYLRRREELDLRRRELRTQYTANRDKLIYEGKYDEARQLQYEYNKDSAELDREVSEFEEEHQRELTRIARDAEKERLNDLKEELQEQLKARRDNLQAQLEAITEYIPKNAAEADAMKKAILDAMGADVGAFADVATSQQQAWASGWQTAWGKTAQDMADEAHWAGTETLKAFARALGVDEASLNLSESQPLDTSNRPTYTTTGGGNQSGISPNPWDHELGSDNTVGNPVGGSGGGTIRRYHSGGAIGNSSMSPQDVPATLQTGEYVIQRKTVAKLGKQNLDMLNKGNIFHKGGLVGAAGQGMLNAFYRAASNFAGGGSIGGFTGEQYKNALANAAGLGGGGALGAGFFQQGEEAAMAITDWLSGRFYGMNKSFVERVANWAKGLGQRFGFYGFRSRAEQEALYRQKPNLAAPPGKSWHEKGLAMDLNPHTRPEWRRLAEERFGLYFPMASLTGQSARSAGGKYEPWHIQPIETKGHRAENTPLGSVPGSDDGGVPFFSGGDTGGLQLRGDLINRNVVVNLPQGGVKDLAATMMQQRGWGMDQWPSLDQLVSHESGWRTSAANPSSSARGLFQFLRSTWGSYITNRGGPPYWNEDPTWQIRGGLDYIGSRYGNPQKAWDFWQRNHWYHEGGLAQLDKGGSILRDGVAKLHKRETVLTAPLSEDLTNAIQNLGSGGDTHVHLEIGQFFGSDRELEKLGKELERVMQKINRAKGLQNRTFSKT